MLWASLNTGIERFYAPAFPADTLDLIHGLRALLVLVAAYLAGVKILLQRSFPWSLFRGPLGLMALYGLVGLAVSPVSPEPLTAFYWAAAYLSVFVVLAAFLGTRDGLVRIGHLLNLNWLMVAVQAALVVVVGREVLFSGSLWPSEMPGYGVQRVMPEMWEMPMVFATGVSRFAAVLGIVCLARAAPRGRVRLPLCALSLVFSLILLFLYQSRGAISGFVVAGFLVVLLRLGPKWKVVVPAAAIAVLAVMWDLDVQEAVGEYLARRQSPEDFYGRLSGRLDLWEAGWELFNESPLLGLGFHADRLVLKVHMHNSWLHALVQTGLLGAGFFGASFAAAWILLVRAIRGLSRMRAMRNSLLIETAGVLAFFTVRSIPESTGAFYGVDWLLLAPLLAYITMLNQNKSALNTPADMAV